MPTGLSSSEDYTEEETNAFSDFIYGNRINLFLILIGLIFLGSGVLLFRNYNKDTDIQVVRSAGGSEEDVEIVVEIAGAVESPGVYTFRFNSRVEDLLIKSGGLSADADRVWVEKYINRAAKLSDGQKYYIPEYSEQSLGASANNSRGETGGVWGVSEDQGQLININTASQKELESLSGIGPVYAQNIIDHRPYSSVDDLLTKNALKPFVYEKIKDKVSVY
jgi:competence protein ComEA